MSMTTATKPTTTQLADTIAPPRPGYATTEFWLTLLGSVFGILVGLHVIGPDFAKSHEQLVNALALFASIIAPGLYAIGRSITKHGQTAAAASVLNTRISHGLTAEQAPKTGTAKRSSAGFALLALIGVILLVVGVILIVAAAADSAHTFAPYLPGVILAAVGLVLLWVDGGLGYSPRHRL